VSHPIEEERFRAFIELILDAIALVEPDGAISYVSPSIVRVLGHTAEEFVGFKAFDVVHPEEREQVIQRLADIVRQPGSSQTAVNRVRHKDGSWRWIETVLANQVENPRVRAIVANFRDITDRRRIEVALREREEHFRLIVESAIDYAIFTLSLDGHISSWNVGAERILGYREEEILGRHVSIIFTPEDNAKGRADFEMHGAVIEGHGNDDRWHLKKGGIRFWANGMMMPLKDEAGEIQGYLKILRDRTEQKLAEETLRDADRRKDEFLAILAHELRNPLAAITNAVQLSLRSARDEELAWSKVVIARQAKNLARLLDDLLDVSRITREKIQLHEERIDLASIITRAVESVRPLIEQKKHNLTLSIAQGYMGLLADQTRIEQVLVNLLTNAATYTKEGGHITLTTQHAGKVKITVKDNGVGIPPDMLPRIFDLFVQVDRTIDRSLGGLGIGLTLVKKIVEMHGGTVTAASEGIGKGSEFTVELPAVAEPIEDSPPTHPSEAAKAPAGLHVLVADDNPDTAAGLTKLLHASGYRVTTAGDGLAALEAARVERPEVILMDIGLPGMDGYRIAEQLRKEKGCENAVLIAISGYGQEQDRRRSSAAGFDYHLVKPVDYELLLSLLARPKSTSPDKLEQ
jgi:PAS domain S-box-containing protein